MSTARNQIDAIHESSDAYDEMALETQSDAFLHRPPGTQVRGGRLLAIAGASGAGKTTLARALTQDAQVFIETVQGNPYLADLLSGIGPFNAFENQMWFLSQVEIFLERANPSIDFVLDQDPSAIVRIYGRLFRDQGQITVQQYTALLIILLRIEHRLEQWQSRRGIIFLDAPAAVLRDRVCLREGQSIPPIVWFEQLSAAFREFYLKLPNVLIFRTNEVEIPTIIQSARFLLRDI